MRLLAFCVCVSSLMAVSAVAAPQERSRALAINADAEFATDGQFSANGRFYATTSFQFDNSGFRFAHNVQSTNFHAWDIQTGAVYARWKLRSLQKFSLSPDGRTVATATGTNIYASGVQLREARSGKVKRTLFRRGAIAAAVHSLTWSRDGRWLATGSGDGLARVWDATSGRRVATLHVGGYVGALAFSPDGHTLAAVGDRQRGWIALYNWKRKKPLGGRRFDSYSIYAMLSFSPDGKRLAVGDESDGMTILYDVPDLEQPQRIPAPAGSQNGAGTPVPKLAWSRDGRRVTFVSGSSLLVRDSTFQKPLWRRSIKRTGWGQSSGDYVVALQFLSDGRLCWITVRRSYDSSGTSFWNAPKLWWARP